ncbi:hypothetical protein SAMN06269117_12517 [Balnearium lithotrophicum]|uniref:Uncharacterized protein n=1 Tax=Balnearium lithotrophicum TaxID=223788 RepID=A0A521DT02_9BACT|nr:hypothetical protein [Balnearium lithotrophicum]SMO74748.1 hypothetical protein SAMN06269117_12517 [Balnearium lithotrophicum]
MRFRTVRRPNMKWCGFFIGNSKDFILVIPFGSTHIFSYLEIVDREVKKQAQRIKKNVIDVYVDILPVAGNRDKTLLKFTYNKRTDEINWLEGKEFSIQDIPHYLLENIKEVYKKNKNVFLEFLLPSEKKKFETVLSL